MSPDDIEITLPGGRKCIVSSMRVTAEREVIEVTTWADSYRKFLPGKTTHWVDIRAFVSGDLVTAEPKTTRCSYCGSKLKDEWLSCPKCGGPR